MGSHRKSVSRRLIESAANAVHEAGFDVLRSPFKYRVIHALSQRGIRDVLDIGANTGQFARSMRRAKVRGRIVSVEPLADAFEQLRAHAAGDAAWLVERAAVSAAPGTVTINVSENSASSSVLPMLDRHAVAAPESRYVGAEEVAATTVDELVARHDLDPETTLLKIDVQGHELAVLEGAAATLGRFGAVRAELTLVPLYEGQALLPDVVDHLRDHGLDLWVLEQGFTDPVTRRQLQFDGTFFRRDP